MNRHTSADFDKICPDLVSSYSSESSDRVPIGWDCVILTASNEDQALSYRKQIKYRLKMGFLPKSTCYAVVADISGQRIGSGGAVFNVLRYISEVEEREDHFSGKRILVIHSGGDSKRIPQYSACGKIFLPVPRELSEGISATLFDELIRSVDELPSRMPAGMLIVTGDILLVFDPLQIDLNGCDAAAISVSENVRVGTNHGVFAQDKDGCVRKFLHKLPADELGDSGAVDSGGNVHLDTGTIYLSSRVVKDLFYLISTNGKIDYDKFSEFANEKVRLSFYADFVYPMAIDSSLDRFYLEKPEDGYSDKLKNCRTALWQVLHRYPMKLICLSPALFIHFGTTAELLHLMTGDIKKYSCLGWEKMVNASGATSDRYIANSSFIDSNTEIGEGSYVENSCIYNSKVGNKCIISNITLDSVVIPDNTVIHCLKQNDGDYVVRVYGVADNPKKSMHEDGTIFGIPLYEYIKKNKMSKDEVWGKEPYDLWNAKLFLKSRSSDESLKYALSLNGAPIQAFQAQKKISLKQSSERADFSHLSIMKKEKDG